MVELVSIHSFLIKRMMAAADEIFDAVKDNIIEYQKEIERLKQENSRLKNTLRFTIKPRRAEASNGRTNAQGTGSVGLQQDVLTSELSEINLQMEVATVMSLEPTSHASTNTSALSEVTKEQVLARCLTHPPELLVKNEGDVSLDVQSSVTDDSTQADNQAGRLSSPEVQHGNISDGHIESPGPEQEPISHQPCQNKSNGEPSKAPPNHPAICSVCSKSFGNKKCLRMHKVVHQSERPFGCDSCGWSFKLKSHLTEHKRLHTGDYRYKCPKCEKGFSRSNLVKMHLKSVHSS
ncbi:uncharacterized protein [Paramisgurnus dabryanus]|uniref:uncharacterized protein n=1 Tax=Paramisgurnus dabryanus TaxID=90735 RepID=UPI0031F3C9A3